MKMQQQAERVRTLGFFALGLATLGARALKLAHSRRAQLAPLHLVSTEAESAGSWSGSFVDVSFRQNCDVVLTVRAARTVC